MRRGVSPSGAPRNPFGYKDGVLNPSQGRFRLWPATCPRAQKGSVDNVHTSGFGMGRTGNGLGRIRTIFGKAAALQGLDPGAIQTRAQFSGPEAFGPLSVHKLCCEGPLRGLLHWWPVLWPVASFLPWVHGLSFVTSSRKPLVWGTWPAENWVRVSFCVVGCLQGFHPGSWWLCCFFMVGPGESDMTCARSHMRRRRGVCLRSVRRRALLEAARLLYLRTGAASQRYSAPTGLRNAPGIWTLYPYPSQFEV